MVVFQYDRIQNKFHLLNWQHRQEDNYISNLYGHTPILPYAVKHRGMIEVLQTV